jgi:hypothetical protein
VVPDARLNPPPLGVVSVTLSVALEPTAPAGTVTVAAFAPEPTDTDAAEPIANRAVAEVAGTAGTGAAGVSVGDDALAGVDDDPEVLGSTRNKEP